MKHFMVVEHNGVSSVACKGNAFGEAIIATFCGVDTSLERKSLAYDDACGLVDKLNDLVVGYVACYEGAVVNTPYERVK